MPCTVETGAVMIPSRGTRLNVRGFDALDGTPVLDIKPYLAGIDYIKE